MGVHVAAAPGVAAATRGHGGDGGDAEVRAPRGEVAPAPATSEGSRATGARTRGSGRTGRGRPAGIEGTRRAKARRGARAYAGECAATQHTDEPPEHASPLNRIRFYPINRSSGLKMPPKAASKGAPKQKKTVKR